MSIRVAQLAKELGLKPPELLEKLNAIGIPIKSQGMPLDDAQEKKAREELGKKEEKAEKKTAAKKTTAKKADAKASSKPSKEDEARAKRLEAVRLNRLLERQRELRVQIRDFWVLTLI